MKKIEIKIGQKFDRLTILREMAPKKINSNQTMRIFEAKCNCGNIKTYFLTNLRRGKSKSCRCISIERTTRHKMHGTRIYTIWAMMLQRCNNKKSTNYKNYGGRGIKVCKRWLKFENFLADMGPTYKDKLTLDRINNNKGYLKNNCRWATIQEQSRNTSKNYFLKFKNKNQCIAAWNEELGFNRGTIPGRIKRGWSIEKTLTTPVKQLGY